MAEQGEAVLASLTKRIINMETDIFPDSKNYFEENTEDFVEKMKNYNTKVKTKSDLSKFTTWLKARNECRNLENMLPKELDGYLARFYLNIRKQDGTEYEPTSLSCFRQSVWRYLKDHGYSTNIMTDPVFIHSTDVLKAKRKELKSQGKGNRPQKSEAFSSQDLDILYSKNLI
jgi:hypothetical protein